MALLNYTTTISVGKTVGEMHSLLVQAGAQRIATDYSPVGTPLALTFQVDTAYGPREFRLPADTSRVLAAMRRNKVPPRYCKPEQAERVAWRILKDWLEAQLALLKIDMVALDQVMLPYMQADGRTFYEVYRERQMLELEEGSISPRL